MSPKLILTLCLVVAPILAAGSQATAAAPTWPTPPSFPPTSWSEFHTSGPASCNCPKEDAEPEEHTVCVSSTIKVKVGAEFISVETGVTEGTCATKRLKPGKCLYYVYNFICSPGGLFTSPKCIYVSAGTFTRDTTTRDCPDQPKGI